MSSKIILKVFLKEKQGRRERTIEARITDGFSLTIYSDPQQAAQAFQQAKANGQAVNLEKNVLKEIHKDMNAEDIAKMMEDQVKALKKKLEKYMQIKYERVGA